MAEQELCWLCRTDVSSELMKKKRLKISGKSAEANDVLSILQDLGIEYLDFDLRSDVSGLSASGHQLYLCRKCITKVQSLEKKRKEIVTMRDEILTLLESKMDVELLAGVEYFDSDDDHCHHDRSSLEQLSTCVPAGLLPMTQQLAAPTKTGSSTPSRNCKRKSSKVNVSFELSARIADT